MRYSKTLSYISAGLGVIWWSACLVGFSAYLGAVSLLRCSLLRFPLSSLPFVLVVAVVGCRLRCTARKRYV